jgi:hypothetical protein
MRKPGLRRAFCWLNRRSLCRRSYFFGFAFLAHLLQLAPGFFPDGLDFLPDFGCRFFRFW